MKMRQFEQKNSQKIGTISPFLMKQQLRAKIVNMEKGE